MNDRIRVVPIGQYHLAHAMHDEIRRDSLDDGRYPAIVDSSLTSLRMMSPHSLPKVGFTGIIILMPTLTCSRCQHLTSGETRPN